MMANGARFGTSYFKRIRLYLRYLVNYLIIFLTILNNGDILSDGRDKKYNEM